MMKLPDLHYYDLVRAAGGVGELAYTPEEAQKNVMAALAPLGPDYAAACKRAFSERWIDLYPTEGKRSGAYSNGGAYDVHPYMLINYNGKYADMTTVAHELGHTMQSYLSNKTQPFALAGYPIFVAEVASTFNEALLIDHMLKTITDNATQAIAPWQLPRRHQGHGLPADAVCGIRASHARDGARRGSR